MMPTDPNGGTSLLLSRAAGSRMLLRRISYENGQAIRLTM